VYHTASAKVLKLFANSPSVQKSMGYNTENLDHPIPFKPTVAGHRLCKAKNVTIPADLATQLPGHTFKQLPGIHLTRKDVLRVGSFVLVSDRLSCCVLWTGNSYFCVGQIQQWGPVGVGANQSYVGSTEGKKGQICCMSHSI
jgi:hypothetical protein